MLKFNSSVPFDECHTVSVKEFAESTGTDYIEAQGFIKFLVSQGIAKAAGVRKIDGQKGKPTNLYLVPMCIQMTVYEEKAA